jgi:hypothetical protein
VNELETHKIKFVKPNEKLDISKIKMNKPQMAKIETIVKQKGGKIIEGIYITRASKIVLKCKENHQWQTNMAKIMSGSWCHTCGLEVEEDTKEKISDTLKKFNQTEKGKEIKKKGISKTVQTKNKKKAEIRATISHKICKEPRGCGENKPISEFGPKAAGTDGLQTHCKICCSKNKKIWKDAQKAKNKL